MEMRKIYYDFNKWILLIKTYTVSLDNCHHNLISLWEFHQCAFDIAFDIVTFDFTVRETVPLSNDKI